MEHLPLFVYGTLKSGQAAAARWPHPPLRVESACVRGALFDLGPYPALTEGEEVISGELWHIAAEHMADTIDALDRFEGFGVGGTDLYVRRVVPVTLQDDSIRRAFAYFFANPKLLVGVPRIRPNQAGICEWSGSDSEPKSL